MAQSKKTKTINLQGKDYAQVKDRLKEFREDCPNGVIETEPSFQPDGQIIFKAHIKKDKAEDSSAEATGHAWGQNKGQKAFEKLETIAVGRALALLGYSSDGDIASSEEMEEFYAYQEEKKQKMLDEATAKIEEAKTLEELKDIWASIDGSIRKELTELKDSKKAKLNENS